jgi:hypothetical protein
MPGAEHSASVFSKVIFQCLYWNFLHFCFGPTIVISFVLIFLAPLTTFRMTHQPKSIIHQIFRVAKSLSRRTEITKKDKKKPRSSKKKIDHDLDTSSGHTLSTVLSAPTTQSLHEDEDSQSEIDEDEASPSEILSGELPPPEEKKLLVDSGVFSSWQKKGEYRTVTQDDIIDKCLGKNAGMVVIHFYSSEELEQGEHLDKQLTQLASLFRGCKFLRVEGSRAPLMARKLNVKKFSTIVAINNGNFKHSLSDTEGKKQGFVQEWFFKTGFVNFFPGCF